MMNIRNLAIAMGVAAAGAVMMTAISLPVFAADAATAAPKGSATAEAPLPRITIRYSDRDLSSDRGVQILYARLKTAADAVCSSAEPRDLAMVAAVQACYRDALAQAVDQVRAPALTALHQQKIAHPVSG